MIMMPPFLNRGTNGVPAELIQPSEPEIPGSMALKPAGKGLPKEASTLHLRAW